MKDNVEETLENKKARVKAFFSRVASDFLSEVKRPLFWVGCCATISGITMTALAKQKVAKLKKENAALMRENERLGKQVNEAWYQAGKLQQQVINNKK